MKIIFDSEDHKKSFLEACCPCDFELTQFDIHTCMPDKREFCEKCFKSAGVEMEVKHD